ncbi:MAG: ATP-binding protein [Methylococcales bacterium]
MSQYFNWLSYILYDKFLNLTALVLEVASVAGAEFSAAVLAAGIETERETQQAKVEEICARLVRRQQFLQACGSAEWPDGTLAGRYGFIHALYQEVLYERVPAGQRVALHRRLGARVEAAYGQRAHEIAAELALHFERGREVQRAVHYHRQAAETAVRRSANVEAMAHLSRGLKLLETLPDTPERSQREIQLQLALAGRLMVAHSPTAPEVESAYARARALCQQTEDTVQLFFALRGLWEVYFVRAELPETRALAEQLLGVARRGQDPLSLSEAYRALGSSLLWLGEVGPAQQHFADSLALVDTQRDHSYAFRNALDARVSCLSFWSLALCHQGYPAQALQKGEAALDLARELGDPFSSAFALYFLARLHQTRGEGQPAGAPTEALVALATEHDFCPYGWPPERSCGAAGWSSKGKPKKALGRYTKVWPRGERPGPGEKSAIFLPSWPRPMEKSGEQKTGWQSWLRRWQWWIKTESVCMRRSWFGSKENCLCSPEARSPEPKIKRQKAKRKAGEFPTSDPRSPKRKRNNVFTRPSPLHGAKGRSRWNCGR